jgi:hypothetical protein
MAQGKKHRKNQSKRGIPAEVAAELANPKCGAINEAQMPSRRQMVLVRAGSWRMPG